MKRFALLVTFGLAVAACTSSGPVPSTPTQAHLLLFTKAAGFVHASIPTAIAAIQRSGAAQLIVDVTDDGRDLTTDNLKRYKAVVFLLTSGDVLDDAQQRAFEQFVAGGGGFAGVHSATDTEYGWPWYHETLGATFKSHPKIQRAAVVVNDKAHPSTAGIPEMWVRTDEWYNFRDLKRDLIHPLLSVSEETYTGGTMAGDHPISWCRTLGPSRVWYTAMGHDASSYSDELFLTHVLGGIRWVADTAAGGCGV